jgi:hypothetical protein
MPANNTGQIVKDLHEKYPDKIGLLNNPFSIKKPIKLHAFDNGCFVKFDVAKYFVGLIKLRLMYEKGFAQKPMFVVCPDVVGCHTRTLSLWHSYYDQVKAFNFPVAFVAQDDCTPEAVPQQADWIFIGGAPGTGWKMNNVHKFIGERPVHVGRVNGKGRLETCLDLGVASVDGTGWFAYGGKQTKDFLRFFEGDEQCSLF